MIVTNFPRVVSKVGIFAQMVFQTRLEIFTATRSEVICGRYEISAPGFQREKFKEQIRLSLAAPIGRSHQG